jgi:hypothetical protein
VVVRRGPQVSPCRCIEKTLVTLRKVPGALALGLLASLAAHASLYGVGHAMGGAYHALILQAALAATLSLAFFFGALAWTESGGGAVGSVLAARLRERLPPLAGILLAATAWYGAAEAVEPHHASALPIAVLVALALAAWLVLRLAQALIAALAGVVIAILRASFSPRTPLWKRRPRSRPLARRTHWVRRLFARPPPIATLARA